MKERGTKLLQLVEISGTNTNSVVKPSLYNWAVNEYIEAANRSVL